MGAIDKVIGVQPAPLKKHPDDALFDQYIEKSAGWLTAAINLAIKDDVLHFNPFSGAVPSRKWFAENKPDGRSVKRLPLSEEDMAALRNNLSALKSEDVMLFELLARTGMRPSEAYQIREEFNEAGIRYVIVGAKTDSSERAPVRARWTSNIVCSAMKRRPSPPDMA